MIVQCEKCDVSFQLDDRLIKQTGTPVRCSKCKHIFKVYPLPSSSDRQPNKAAVSPKAVQKAKQTPLSDAPKPDQKTTRKTFSDQTLTNVDFSEEAFGGSDQGVHQQFVELGNIGEGGMGAVALARDTFLLRKVAIKSLKDEITSPAAVRYFLREAQITAQLDHPNIVPLYSVKPPEPGQKNVSFVMKLIKGRTLTDVINKARESYEQNPKAVLPPDVDLNARLGYFLKACEGIIYAHRKQVVHRDLKPSNIMIGDYGEVYVMDWGIAKMTKDAPETIMGMQEVLATKKSMTIFSENTQSGRIVGTPNYMSPEQAKGDPDVGPESDIFSLGVILYELVTLNPARPAGDAASKMKWAETGELNPVEPFVEGQKIPPELNAIIQKATAFDRSERYSSVSDLAEDVRAFLRADEVSALPDSQLKKVWRWMNRHRELTVIIGLSVFLLLATITIFSQYQKQAALIAAQKREARLTQLLAQVSTQAHQIDSRFLRLEDLLIGLANNAMYLIQDAPANNELFYWMSDFQNTAKAPPDYSHAQYYKRAVSIDYPVVKLAPGVKPEDVRPLMQKLAPLRYHFKKTILDSRNSLVPLSNDEARRLMTVHGVSVSWVYIGLEAGVMYSYPGKTYPDDYDPRKRPWYALGKGKTSVRWGNPYFDLFGLGMVLPCATSLYDRENTFYGVIGMDVTYSNIIQENLRRPGAIGVAESYLLDEKGRIVVRSSALNIKIDEKQTDPTLKLLPFPVDQVVKSIERKESGLTEIKKEGKSRIIVFQLMKSLGWYYVEEVNTEEILKIDES